MIDETVEEIEAMRTHSSSEVALRAVGALGELLDREYATAEEFVRDVERNCAALRRANPSHATLFNAQHAVVDQLTATEPDDVEAGKHALEAAIEAVTTEIETRKAAAAEAAAAMLEGCDRILTHDFSSTVLGAIERAVAEEETTLEVYVTEARPRLIGRKTARVLAGLAGVTPTLIVDSAAGHFLDECDMVMTGMTCIVGDSLFNRVGTFPLLAAAERVGTPAYVAGSSAKIVEGAFRFENDYRSDVEVLLEPIDGVQVANPAYDETPIELLDAIVTDEGVRSID